MAAFAATVAIGFIVLPEPSISYWLSGYFVRPGRTGGVDALVNQSLLGMIARQTGGGVAGSAGLASDRGRGRPGGHRRCRAAGAGREAGVRLGSGRYDQPAGLADQLGSPLGLDHPASSRCWPGEPMASQTWRRWLFLAGAVVVTALFGAWPWDYSGPDAYVPQRGLVGWFVRPPLSYNVLQLQGWQLLTWNLFVVAGLVIFVIMLVVAGISWRRAKAPAPPPLRRLRRPRPEVEPELRARVRSMRLLARADSLLSPAGVLTREGPARSLSVHCGAGP